MLFCSALRGRGFFSKSSFCNCAARRVPTARGILIKHAEQPEVLFKFQYRTTSRLFTRTSISSFEHNNNIRSHRAKRAPDTPNPTSDLTSGHTSSANKRLPIFWETLPRKQSRNRNRTGMGQ